jgi:hypothetical protein
MVSKTLFTAFAKRWSPVISVRYRKSISEARRAEARRTQSEQAWPTAVSIGSRGALLRSTAPSTDRVAARTRVPAPPMPTSARSLPPRAIYLQGLYLQGLYLQGAELREHRVAPCPSRVLAPAPAREVHAAIPGTNQARTRQEPGKDMEVTTSEVTT